VGHGRVLAVAVPPQVDLALEGLVTESAGERLVAGVLAHVGDQIGRLAEGFAAHDALVWLLTCKQSTGKQNNIIPPVWTRLQLLDEIRRLDFDTVRLYRVAGLNSLEFL